MTGRRFDPAKISPVFFPVFLILFFQSEIASLSPSLTARRAGGAAFARNDAREVIAELDTHPSPVIARNPPEADDEAISKSSPAELVEVTDRMRALAKSLEHMPEPPQLGAIQISMIDLKRSPAGDRPSEPRLRPYEPIGPEGRGAHFRRRTSSSSRKVLAHIIVGELQVRHD